MKFRAAIALLLFTLAVSPALRASNDSPTPSPTPTLLTRTLQILHLKRREPSAPGAKGQADSAAVSRQLDMKMALDPTPVTLSDTRQVKVTITLLNRSKQFVHLDFPTSQRVDVALKSNVGKTLTQWSEDQSFTDDLGSITINPGERLEYSVFLSTREMAAGQTYIVEGYFPSYPDFKVDESIGAAP